MGPAAALYSGAAAAMLRGSQVCSALRFFRCAQKTRSGLRPPTPQRWAMARCARRRLRRLKLAP
ncbi:hypothetical protein SGRA_1469 [Saprospira grandis str. Lewin]|uniref:Uncharacterized protein n=1 Tax=Saprospira grandis (strain Lewin) TaxID=984262 RepID=H6L7Y3_SAPGL|nr:hypothetical protein SGRA_1469 [Saprospira grandis str. Lewin]